MFGSGQLQATFGWAAPFFGMSLLSLTFAGIIGSLPHDLFTPADRRAVEGTPTEPAKPAAVPTKPASAVGSAGVHEPAAQDASHVD